jgi:hypothetical protein
MKKVHEIKGIYDEDLPKLLEDLNLKDDFYSGKIHCTFSNEIVTMKNLLSIFSDGEEIKFVCDNEIARASLSELNKKKNDY